MKFSLLTACYNKKPFIKQAFNSVMSQTHKDLEWIIVDDYSTDRSWHKISHYTAADPRIKSVRLRGRHHCAGAYAQCMKMASGDVMGVLDMDDLLLPSAIENLVSLYEKYKDIGYIYTQHDIVTHKLNLMRRGVSSLPKEGKSFALMATEKRHCFSHFRTCRMGLVEPDVLFPAGLQSIVDKHMGFVLEEIAPGGFYDEVTYRYRWYTGDNISCTVNQRGKYIQKKRWLKMASKFIDKRKKHSIKTFPVVKVSL